MRHSFFLLSNFLVFQTPSSDSSASCLSHLPLYFLLFRAGFGIFPLFFATFTHPLMSWADLLKFLCVTLGLPTHHQAQTQLPQLLGSTGLGSWMCNSATFLTGSLSPSHFLWGCLKGCARGGRAERCQEEQAGGKSSSVPLAARSVSSNSFKPKRANASNPKVHSYPANSHFVKVFCFLALLQFLSVPLPVQDSCPPQIFAVQWKKAVSGLLKLASINKIKVHNFFSSVSEK